MKKIAAALPLVLAFAFLGCAGPEQPTAMESNVIKTDDELSNTIQMLFDKYVANDFNITEYYAEDLSCAFNNMAFTGRDMMMAGFKMHHDALYTNISVEDMQIQTEYWSDGSTWSRAWFTWKGQGQTTGTDYSNRGHFDYKWENGQIVEMWGFWSEDVQNTESAALEAATAAAAEMAEEA